MSEIQSPERMKTSGIEREVLASQESLEKMFNLQENSLDKGTLASLNNSYWGDNGKLEADSAGKKELNQLKISPRTTLTVALRKITNEASANSAKQAIENKKVQDGARPKNILEKSVGWVAGLPKAVEASYMNLASMASNGINQAAQAVINSADENSIVDRAVSKIAKTVDDHAGTNNIEAAVNLTEEIFNNDKVFKTKEQIEIKLLKKIQDIILAGEVTVEMFEKELKTGYLKGEAAKVAAFLSSYFNKSSGDVLLAIKNQPNETLTYAISQIAEQILQARLEQAKIDGAGDALEQSVLSRSVAIRDQIKGRVAGVREGLNIEKIAVQFGTGSIGTAVELVTQTYGGQLGENNRMQIIKKQVETTPEFQEVAAALAESLNEEKITEEEYTQIYERVLGKQSYQKYLEVVDLELKNNEKIAGIMTGKGIVGFLKKVGAEFTALGKVASLTGGVVDEGGLSDNIAQDEKLKKEFASFFSAEERSEGAMQLYKDLESFQVTSLPETVALAEMTRKIMTEIPDNGLVVAGKVAKVLLKQLRDQAVSFVAMRPAIVGGAVSLAAVTGGAMAFGGQTGQFTESSLETGFTRNLSIDKEGLSAKENFENAAIMYANRANPLSVIKGTADTFVNFGDRVTGGAVSRTVNSGLQSVDNLFGNNISKGYNATIEGIKGAPGRIGDLAVRAGGSYLDYLNSVKKSVVHTFTSGEAGVAAEITSQPAKSSNVDGLIAQTGANVAKGGAMDFSGRKSGEVVDYKFISNGKEVDLKPTYLGTTEGTSALRIDVENLKKQGYTIAEARSSAGGSFPVIRDSEGKIVENVRTGWLVVDGKPTNVPIIIEGKGRDGNINAKQISEAFASMTPADFAAAKNSGLQIKDNTASAKPESTVATSQNTPKAQTTAPTNSSTTSTFANSSIANSLLNGSVAIGDKPTSIDPNKINSSNPSPSSALDRLRQGAGLPAVESTTTTAQAKPLEQNSAVSNSAPGLRINVNNAGNNFNIYNNSDLAATLGNGEYNSGISRRSIEQVVSQSNLGDLQSRGTVQRLAYLAENKLPIPEELKGLTLSSGAKVEAVYEGFTQNPSSAKDALNGVYSNANAAVNVSKDEKGSFMVLPIPNGLMVNAQRSWNNLVQTITVSSVTTASGDPTIALPNNGQDTTSNSGVKVENGVITARQGIDFKPLSKISLNMGNGISTVIDVAQFPKIMEQLNSGQPVKLSDLLRSVAAVKPEVANAIGAIDTTKPASKEVLNIKAKDGTSVNLFAAIYDTRGLFNVVTNAAGDLINPNNVSSETRDNNILGPALKFLMSATPEQKIAFLNGIKEYNGKYLGPDGIAKLTSDTTGNEERTKWTLNRLFEQRSPGILKQDVITNEDLFKLASGLNFSGTKVLEANVQQNVLKAFESNISVLQRSDVAVPAQLLLAVRNPNNTLSETISAVEAAEDYIRRGSKGRLPQGWSPLPKEDISNTLRNISVVQLAMGEKPAEISKSDTYQPTIGLDGLGYRAKAHFDLYNLNILPKAASENFFKANEENPQVKNVATKAYSNIMGIGIDGVRTGPLVNKLAVSVLSQFLPISFAYSREQTITDSQSMYNLPQQDLANAETVTALAIKFTDPEFAKAYAKFISEKRTPEESLTLALGAKPDAATGKWYVEGRNGFRLTFNNIDELNKFSKMARQSAIEVTGKKAENASSNPNVQVFENNPTASVELGGSTLSTKEAEEFRQYLGNEAENYDNNMAKARKMLVEAQANRNQVSARLTSSYTAASLAQAMGLGPNGFLASSGEYRGGNRDSVMSNQDTTTEVRANPQDVAKYKSELEEYNAGRRAEPPAPLIGEKVKCTNIDAIFGQNIPLTTSGEISTSRKTETDVNVQRNVDTGNEELTAAVVVKPKPQEPEQPKKEEPKDDQMTAEAKVEKDSVSSTAPGKSTDPQSGTNGAINKPDPNATAPTTKHLEINNGGTTNTNIVKPDASSTAGGNVQVDASAANNNVTSVAPDATAGANNLNNLGASNSNNIQIGDPGSISADTVTQTVTGGGTSTVIDQAAGELTGEITTGAVEVLKPL